MAKQGGRHFVCQECGQTQAKWGGRCPNCGAWNSLLEETALPTSNPGLVSQGKVITAQPLNKISHNKVVKRHQTGIEELENVLGGGIVPGSLILVAGEPGIGKSTLLLEVADGVAKNGLVLYVSGEESLEQLKLRTQRLKVTAARLELAASVSSDDVAATIASGRYQLVIVDSVQTMAAAGLSTSAGSISQVTTSTQLFLNAAKGSQTAVMLAGHVTKEGSIAGPKLLEHIVDVVLYLEGERFGNFKLLRSTKNRFGSTYEVGIFEMIESGLVPVDNPSKAFLDERQSSDGSVVLAAIEGSRAILVEVQALVSPSPFGYPKRTAVGFDLNRLNLLLAVLNKRGGMHLGTHDVYINIVSGMRINEPAADLAVAMAIASAARSHILVDKTVVFGEVGLGGEVRKVAHAETRIKEAQKLGFSQAIAPSADGASGFIKVARNLSQAIKLGLENK